MTLQASASFETAATSQEVMELVLDLERYRQVDSKILSVGAVEGPDDEGRGRVRLWSRLKWTPPAPDVQLFELERWSRLTFTGAPKQPSRLVLGFTGTIECKTTPAGTLVTHSYELTFRGPFRILETMHRRWLQHDLEEEMRRMSDILNPTTSDSDPVVRRGQPRGTEGRKPVTTPIALADVDRVGADHAENPAAAGTLHAETYTEQRWYDFEQPAVFARSWQWVCHREKLAGTGDYVTATVAGLPIAVVRDGAGELRGFYNVCKHRAHEIVAGEGSARSLRCPYHGWTYDLDGSLAAARHTKNLVDFDPSGICLDTVQVEEFAGFVFVNLDPTAAPLRLQSGDLGAEIAAWAPDVADLTLARRLTYDIASNWKNVIDNYLECYHCHIAHKDFVSLVDMSTYTVTTHGIYSSQFAEAGRSTNTAYDIAEATVRAHAAWLLWPNTCLMRYPGRGNMMVMHVIPAGPNRTLETYDFFLEDPKPNAAEAEAIRYIDDVLQVEDIGLVESVQRGMRTPAFTSGRFVCDPAGSGVSEHGVHHFHGLLLEAYRNGTNSTG